MAGLVGYDSSDDNKDASDSEYESTRQTVSTATKPASSEVEATAGYQSIHGQQTPSGSVKDSATPPGPIAGPVVAQGEDSEGSARDSASYGSYQELVMNFTLPPIPNFDIPDSPPASPDSAVTERLSQFARLKKEGIHFNERLATSSSIKNPQLFSKLLESFGIGEDEQYATTLPKSLWDPAAFPQWAYKEELAKAQADAQKQRAKSASSSNRVDFVPSTSTRK